MGYKYNYDLETFFREDATSYYLLGAFLTDGCVQEYETKKNVSLTSKDKDWLEDIKKLICPELATYFHNGAWTFTIHSTELANWLINRQCTPRKSLTVTLPNIPEKYFSDFLRGCIDGDGTLGIYNILDKRGKNPKWRKHIVCGICSGSKRFLLELNETLEEVGYHNTFSEEQRKDKNPLYRLTFRGRYALAIVNYIYYTNNQLSLSRKNNIANQIRLYYEEEYEGDITRDYRDQSGDHNSNAKITENNVRNILTQWFDIDATIRTGYGFKKLFYEEKIKRTYPAVTYAMLRDITAGKSWSKVFTELKRIRTSAPTRGTTTKASAIVSSAITTSTETTVSEEIGNRGKNSEAPCQKQNNKHNNDEKHH